MNQFSSSYGVRKEAKIRGEKVYESTPCKTCGSTVKFISSYGCVECARKRDKHKLFDGTMDKYRTPAKDNAKTYRYRARKRNQMPADANKILILAFYEEAQRLTCQTGVPHEVDHRIPLVKGGLHHQNNLQVISRKMNREKGDRF